MARVRAYVDKEGNDHISVDFKLKDKKHKCLLADMILELTSSFEFYESTGDETFFEQQNKEVTLMNHARLCTRDVYFAKDELYAALINELQL